MDSKKLKKIVGNCAKIRGFQQAFGCWYIQSDEVIFVLEMQKSSFSQKFYLNIKIFIQGAFGRKYQLNKDTIKLDEGDIFFRPPNQYESLLDLENTLSDIDRELGIERLFDEYITKWKDKTASIEGIKNSSISDGLFVLPAVKKEIGL